MCIRDRQEPQQSMKMNSGVLRLAYLSFAILQVIGGTIGCDIGVTKCVRLRGYTKAQCGTCLSDTYISA